jgi:MOSC domain-containing protein YiiM
MTLLEVGGGAQATGRGCLISVNLAVPRRDPAARAGITGIDKQPHPGPVAVRAPGAKDSGSGGGLVGDMIGDLTVHGGDDQAVYAYAREDLDRWEVELGRPLLAGVFGENITTRGVDVTGMLIGERWRFGEQVILEVSAPRIPCGTFARWIGEQGWIERFTVAATPGAYFRVIVPGQVRAGDPIVSVSRPSHTVTVGLTFRALTREPELLPLLLAADALPTDVRKRVARRTGQPEPRSSRG